MCCFLCETLITWKNLYNFSCIENDNCQKKWLLMIETNVLKEHRWDLLWWTVALLKPPKKINLEKISYTASLVERNIANGKEAYIVLLVYFRNTLFRKRQWSNVRKAVQWGLVVRGWRNNLTNHRGFYQLFRSIVKSGKTRELWPDTVVL